MFDGGDIENAGGLYSAVLQTDPENAAAVASVLARFQGRHVFSFVRYGSDAPGT